jgi:flavin reductase (DIM6/NTAB) family NADH-FMN oxidoreductase RutF
MGGAHSEVDKALALLPSARSIMTAAFEQARAGVLVQWVMQCASSPVFICVAVLKGNRISPIIRDSRCFALCLVDGKSKLLLKKFDENAPEGDQFDAFGVRGLKTGSPVLTCSIAAIDCEVVRHFDLEADHELYIGQVMDARVFGESATRP